MVDLNDEAAVDRQTEALLRFWRDSRDRGAAVERARQGGELAYRADGSHDYLLDRARQTLYGPQDDARTARLAAHGHQVGHHPAYREARALYETVGDGGAAVPPAYLQNFFEAGAHPLRATADLCRPISSPMKALTLNIPAFTAGSGMGTDTTQNSTLSEGDPSDAFISGQVQTVAGKLLASRQLIDQSSADSKADEILGQDLGAAYGAELDSLVLTGSGGTGQITGLINTSGALSVAAGTSVAGLVDGVVTGYQLMVNTRYRKPDVCIMHPRRWLSGFANSIDNQGRPLLLPTTHPAALVGTADDGVVAEWLGMQVVLDVNVPTSSGSGSQDYVILGHSSDWLLFEGPWNFMADKSSLAYQMSVNLIAYRYAALVVRYPTSVCLVGPFNAPTVPGS